jgi:hypothetical protein
MTTQARGTPGRSKQVAVLLLVFGLAVANSLLFYFVIWDQLSNWEPISVLLFFVSGGAHLIYFFLPWFARELFAPVLDTSTRASRRLRDPNNSTPARATTSTVAVATWFGAALCATAIGLLLVQIDLFPAEEKPVPYISEANCIHVGGTLSKVDGKVTCVLDPNAAVAPAGPAANTEGGSGN